MILYEHEAKALLATAGLNIPKGTLVSTDDLSSLSFPGYLKAQVLHGNRAQQGLVVKVESLEQAQTQLKTLLASQDGLGQPVTAVLFEPAINFTRELYFAISYDTRYRQPILQYALDAGTGIEDRVDSLQTVLLSATTGGYESWPTELPTPLQPVLSQLWQVFSQNDASLVEINPIVETSAGWFCLDAKVELEDVAGPRHPEWETYPERSAMGRPPTALELKAREVSRSDHRGVAGESFFEFPGGTIGVMASGGGASTLAMDALMAVGLKPANYTEYSGNPTREKVEKLTHVVLAIPNLEALYVVGSTANFTDIYETLAGLIDGLLVSPYVDQPGFALLVRRGGPRWQEAFEMINERLAGKPLKIKLLGPDFPLIETAAELKKLMES